MSYPGSSTFRACSRCWVDTHVIKRPCSLTHARVLTVTRSHTHARSHCHSSRTTCDGEMPPVHQENLVNSGRSFSKHCSHDSLYTITRYVKICSLRPNLQHHGPGVCILTSHTAVFFPATNLRARDLSREKAERGMLGHKGKYFHSKSAQGNVSPQL